MSPNVSEGIIHLRWYNSDGEIIEEHHSFASLNDLFGLCLTKANPSNVHHITLVGTDAIGETRRVTLTFRSVTGKEPSESTP